MGKQIKSTDSDYSDIWLKRIQDKFKSPDSDKSWVKLSEGIDILPGGNDFEAVQLMMKRKAVIGNMQEDGSAFETWALALKVAGATEVSLQIEGGPPEDDNRKHYNRLCYRCNRFATYFNWFKRMKWMKTAKNNGPAFVLNVEGKPRKDSRSEDSRKEQKETLFKDYSEHQLEMMIAYDTAPNESFKNIFGLEVIDRQLPVGVFKEKVSKDNKYRYFTGGKSGIDLWGLSGKTLFIFELKNSNNKKLGALSELFFYSMVMKDLQDGIFVFDPEKKEAAEKNGRPYLKILGTKKIEAVILAPTFHPLIENGKILNTLNKAVGPHGIRFSLCKLSGGKEGMKFEKDYLLTSARSA